MTYLQPHQVQNPNIVDPKALAELVKEDTGRIPDFYIWFNHPTNPGEIIHVPCRELDRGEIAVLDFAVQEKTAEIPEAWRNIRISDYNEEQRKWYEGFEKEIDALECERNIIATVQVILQDGWTETLVKKLLPRRAHRSAYLGGTAARRETDPVVEAFLSASSQGAQAGLPNVPRDAVDEPQ